MAGRNLKIKVDCFQSESREKANVTCTHTARVLVSISAGVGRKRMLNIRRSELCCVCGYFFFVAVAGPRDAAGRQVMARAAA